MALAGKGTLHPGVLPVQALNQALSGRPVLKVVSLSAALFFPSVCYLFVQLCFFVVVVVVVVDKAGMLLLLIKQGCCCC